MVMKTESIFSSNIECLKYTEQKSNVDSVVASKFPAKTFQNLFGDFWIFIIHIVEVD